MTDPAAPAPVTAADLASPEAVIAPPTPAPRPRRDSRLSATSLVDEAAHTLRLAPLNTLGIYYAGALPFALGLLYFWSDMARSADAAERAAGSASGLAGLFLAMKCAQAVFAARLRAQFAREPLPRWTPGRLWRVVRTQAALQAPGLFLFALPVAVFLLPSPFLLNLLIFSVVILPYGWIYVFFQNVTALGDGAPDVTTRQVARRAWKHTLTAPLATHGGLFLLFGLAFFVWLNLLMAVVFLPQLVQMFTGEENVFTRNPMNLFNTTTFLVSAVLVYLAADPLAKTLCALRCFHTDATRTGEDLRTELRALPPVDGGRFRPRAGTRRRRQRHTARRGRDPGKGGSARAVAAVGPGLVRPGAGPVGIAAAARARRRAGAVHGVAARAGPLDPRRAPAPGVRLARGACGEAGPGPGQGRQGFPELGAAMAAPDVRGYPALVQRAFSSAWRTSRPPRPCPIPGAGWTRGRC